MFSLSLDHSGMPQVKAILFRTTFRTADGSHANSCPPNDYPFASFIENRRFEIQAQVFDHHRIRDVLEARGIGSSTRNTMGAMIISTGEHFGDALYHCSEKTAKKANPG